MIWNYSISYDSDSVSNGDIIIENDKFSGIITIDWDGKVWLFKSGFIILEMNNEEEVGIGTKLYHKNGFITTEKTNQFIGRATSSKDVDGFVSAYIKL